jgi:hypothetical protein
MRKDLEQCIKNYENISKIKEEDKSNLLIEISFFQHERLVHLIVTVFAGISTILFLLGFVYFESISIFLLFLLAFLLFIPYIFHYYYLENGVQKLYDIYRSMNK